MVWAWVGFVLFVLLMLALDLGVFHREARAVSAREAVGWSAVWVTLGLAFAAFVYLAYENRWLGLGAAADPVDGEALGGYAAAVKYLTGYVIEKSLSVDNIFVIAMIFASLGVPAVYQHRVLFWGILGALAMRGAMIAVGAELILRFHWVLYLFGAFLIVTAAKMLTAEGHGDPARSAVVRWTKRLFPVTDRFHGEHFVVRAGTAGSHEPAVPGAEAAPDPAVGRAAPGTLMLTPLGLAVILVETTDLVFAVDSIPAIFAVTGDPFLVFTSNVFAILGLRSLYFALAGMLDRFRYLKASLAAVLAIVGTKMLLAGPLKAALGPQANLYLLVVILAVLAIGVVASLAAPSRTESGDRPAGG